jgi:hypothetical protein
MNIHLKIIGLALMFLGLVHVIFPKYFNWKIELRGLNTLHRQMFKIHTFFIALTVFLLGLMSFSLSNDLITTDLGQNICLGIGCFWTIRGVLQFIGYSPTIWKGKLFETIVHILFSGFCIYLSVVYLKIGLV